VGWLVSEHDDEQSRVEPAAFERVYAELDWYDGPRKGLADVDGVAHYFAAVNDYDCGDAHDEEFLIWPASVDTLALERRQWRMFVAWNNCYERGQATVESHPGHGGIDSEYDKLTVALEPGRTPAPHSRTARATWRPTDNPQRYSADGPGYQVRWEISGNANLARQDLST
jgi:hypothetical protein